MTGSGVRRVKAAFSQWVRDPPGYRSSRKQWRMYPVEFLGTRGNPSTAGSVGTIRETAGFPQAYNIEADPKEEVNVIHTNGWLIAPYLQLVNKYRESLKAHPNPPAANLTNIR